MVYFLFVPQGFRWHRTLMLVQMSPTWHQVWITGLPLLTYLPAVVMHGYTYQNRLSYRDKCSFVLNSLLWLQDLVWLQSCFNFQTQIQAILIFEHWLVGEGVVSMASTGYIRGRGRSLWPCPVVSSHVPLLTQLFSVCLCTNSKLAAR